MVAETAEWVSKSRVRTMLRIAPAKLDGLIEQGLIGVRRLPGGCRARVNLEDAERLLASSTTPGTAGRAAREQGEDQP
jgi:hypothetical protein